MILAHCSERVPNLVSGSGARAVPVDCPQVLVARGWRLAAGALLFAWSLSLVTWGRSVPQSPELPGAGDTPLEWTDGHRGSSDRSFNDTTQARRCRLELRQARHRASHRRRDRVDVGLSCVRAGGCTTRPRGRPRTGSTWYCRGARRRAALCLGSYSRAVCAGGFLSSSAPPGEQGRT